MKIDTIKSNLMLAIIAIGASASMAAPSNATKGKLIGVAGISAILGSAGLDFYQKQLQDEDAKKAFAKKPLLEKVGTAARHLLPRKDLMVSRAFNCSGLLLTAFSVFEENSPDLTPFGASLIALSSIGAKIDYDRKCKEEEALTGKKVEHSFEKGLNHLLPESSETLYAIGLAALTAAVTAQRMNSEHPDEEDDNLLIYDFRENRSKIRNIGLPVGLAAILGSAAISYKRALDKKAAQKAKDLADGKVIIDEDEENFFLHLLPNPQKALYIAGFATLGYGAWVGTDDDFGDNDSVYSRR